MPVGNRASAGYPEAERLKLVEEIHGQRVADPYRWLEDPDDPRTRDWCAQQDELFAEWQARWLGDETSGAAAAHGWPNWPTPGASRSRSGGASGGSSPVAGPARSTRCCSPPARTARSGC